MALLRTRVEMQGKRLNREACLKPTALVATYSAAVQDAHSVAFRNREELMQAGQGKELTHLWDMI